MEIGERRQLVIQTELMVQNTQMEIEKNERDSKLEIIRREIELDQQQIEMEIKLQELQGSIEIAEVKRKDAFEKQQMRLEIQEDEGSFMLLQYVLASCFSLWRRAKIATSEIG